MFKIDKKLYDFFLGVRVNNFDLRNFSMSFPYLWVPGVLVRRPEQDVVPDFSLVDPKPV